MDIAHIAYRELMFDEQIWPRQAIDPQTVRELAEALRAGESLPPIIVDRRSRKVADGWHRSHAYRILWGDEALVPAELRDYVGDQEMFEDAVALNARHGRRLSPYDRTVAILKAESFGLTIDRTAYLLGITAERVAEIKVRRVGWYRSQPVALKNSLRRLAGQELTEQQFQANSRVGGMDPTYYIRYALSLLRAGAFDLETPRHRHLLVELHTELGRALNEVAVGEAA